MVCRSSTGFRAAISDERDLEVVVIIDCPLRPSRRVKYLAMVFFLLERAATLSFRSPERFVGPLVIFSLARSLLGFEDRLCLDQVQVGLDHFVRRFVSRLLPLQLPNVGRVGSICFARLIEWRSRRGGRYSALYIERF